METSLPFYLELTNYDYENIFRCNLNVSDINEVMKVTDPFRKEILEYWAETNFEHQIIYELIFQEQALWFNSLISQFFFKYWF